MKPLLNFLPSVVKPWLVPALFRDGQTLLDEQVEGSLVSVDMAGEREILTC